MLAQRRGLPVGVAAAALGLCCRRSMCVTAAAAHRCHTTPRQHPAPAAAAAATVGATGFGTPHMQSRPPAAAAAAAAAGCRHRVTGRARRGLRQAAYKPERPAEVLTSVLENTLDEDSDAAPLPNPTTTSTSSSSSSSSSSRRRGSGAASPTAAAGGAAAGPQPKPLASTTSSSGRRRKEGAVAVSSTAQQQQQGRAREEAARVGAVLRDINPAVLETMGYTGVTHFLQQRCQVAVRRAKTPCLAAVVWGLGFLVAFGPLGGSLGYHADLALLTDGGRHLELIGYLWVALLSYFSVKCSVNVGVTNVVAWWMEQRVEEGEGLPEELEGAEVDDEGHFKDPAARLAWWSLQERLHRADKSAQRAYAEAALSCALLGLQLLALGGPDVVQLRMEVLDQEAYCRLILGLWLFWESYFAGIAAVVRLGGVGAALWRLWSWEQLSGTTAVVDEVVDQANRIMRGGD